MKWLTGQQRPGTGLWPGLLPGPHSQLSPPCTNVAPLSAPVSPGAGIHLSSPISLQGLRSPGKGFEPPDELHRCLSSQGP